MQRNLLVLGGAGEGGVVIVRQALERNHKVTAYARNVAKLKDEHGPAITNGRLTVSKDFPDSQCPNSS